MTQRKSRASVEDRWHRPPRKGEQPPWPADDARAGCWCTDPKHGEPGKLVTTARHGTGLQWMARWVDNDGATRALSFKLKGDATKHVRQVTADLVVGTYVDRKSSAVTFGVVAEEWFAAKQPGLKPSTVGGYRSLLDMTVLPRWRDTRLIDIGHGDIQQWVTWMTTSKDARQPRTTDEAQNAKRKPLSARRAVQAHGMVKQVLGYAIRTKRLAVNPADEVQLPRVVHRGETSLSHQQVAALVAAAGDAGPIVLTLTYTGCRFGELAALRVRDVDLERGRILVSRGVTQVTGVGLVEDTTKTHQARSVPILTAELTDTLRTVVAGRQPDEYLFPAPTGGPMRNSHFRYRFDQACKATQLVGVSIKTLRHSAGSLAIASGASVVTAQRLLGHKDATTTLRIYSHMLPDDFDNLATAMDAAAKGHADSSRRPSNAARTSHA
jgi:integrase